jgi:hypothetical protein
MGDQGVFEACEVAGGGSEEGVTEDREAHEDDDEDAHKLHAARDEHTARSTASSSPLISIHSDEDDDEDDHKLQGDTGEWVTET